MGCYGYQGFKSFETRAPPALKPGETIESRNTKFRRAAPKNIYLASFRDTTVTAEMSQHLKPSDYKVPDRRGVSAKFEPIHESKPSATATTSRVSYRAYDPRDAATIVEAPEWLSSKKCAKYATVFERHLKSSYQTDMGMAGEIPAHRPFVVKNTMAATTLDLAEGTTKATYHVPGYKGHICLADRSPWALDQSDGRATRAPHYDLKMSYSHNIPGYAGSVPISAINDKGPRTTGTDPRTSSGAKGEIL